jgi:hypothetical protein
LQVIADRQVGVRWRREMSSENAKVDNLRRAAMTR